MRKSKRYYYELFEPGEPITPKPTPIEEAKEKIGKTHYFLAIAVLFASIMKGIALIQMGN